MGLIINELVNNSLKYAFPERKKGLITVKLLKEDQQLVLNVSDDGIGMDEALLSAKKESFGHSLIRAFKEKLDAELEITGSSGTNVTLKIKNFKQV